MDAHGVEVLDRAHDDDVVERVAHHLELELVPAAHRLLDEHLADRRLAQADLDLPAQLLRRRREAAAVTAERERGPDDGRHGDVLELVERRDDARLGHAQADRAHGVAEQLAVLRAPDGVEAGADQLDAERFEDPVLGQLAGEVERRLAAHRRQQGVRPLAPEHVDDALEVERLDVRAVGEARVGHDRRRVRVDDDRAEAVLAQHLQRLAARVVELARLADDDRPRADEADRVEVVYYAAARTSSTQDSISGRASCGPGPASGWNCSERARSSG